MQTSATAEAITSRSLDHLLRALLLVLLPLCSVLNVRAQGEAEHAYLLTLANCTTTDREKAVWDALVGWGVFVRVEVVRVDQQVKMLSNNAIDRASVEQALAGTNVSITSMVDLMTGAHMGPDNNELGAFVQPGEQGPTHQDDPAYTLAKHAWLAAHPTWQKEHPDASSEVDIENE
jgi:hypothetical protein